MPQVKERLSWRKRMTFNLLMIIGAWLILECVSLGIHNFQYGSLEFQAGRRQAVASQEPNQPGGVTSTAPNLIHPYVGAVQQTTKSTAGDRFHVTDYGFV